MKRDFKGIWIPSEIWLNKDLSLIEKCFIVEIDSLDNSDGCFASNGYFAEFFSISKSRCSQIIKGLETKEFISIQYHYEGKQIIKRVVNILKGGIKKTKGGYLENCEDNNTKVNNTLLIRNKEKNYKKKIKSDFSKPTQDEVNQKPAPLKTEKKEKKQKVPRKRKKAFCVTDCDFPPIFEQNEKLKQTFLDFAEMRQELKKPYKTKKGTETKLNTLAKDCDRFGIDNVIGAIEFSLGSEYLGIFVIDFVNKQQRHEQQQQKINNNNAEPESLHESFAKRIGLDFYKDGNLNGNFTS